MTRAQLIALAEQADEALKAAVEAGDREGALKMLRQAELWREMARLTDDKPSSNLREMTDAQLERRGKAIAAAKNAKTKDCLLKAITGSQWGSQEQYARKRLGISPPALTGYRNGTTPCPRAVADRVLKDFGIAHDYWPAGVVN